MLIYLDVDGVLNPFAAKAHQRPHGYETHRLLPRQATEAHSDDPRYAAASPYRVWLNPHHGQMLSTFAAQCSARIVWATTWEDEANRLISPRIGLADDLEIVAWDPDYVHKPYDRVYFKTSQIVAHAAGRPFIWFDDEVTQADRDYVAVHHNGDAQLEYIDSRLGIRYPDLGSAENALYSWRRKKAAK